MTVRFNLTEMGRSRECVQWVSEVQTHTLDEKHEASAGGWEGEKRRLASEVLRLGTFLGATPSWVGLEASSSGCFSGFTWFLAGRGVGHSQVAGQANCVVFENLDLGRC